MADSIIGKISVGDGATFTPDVTDGVLSFTNNKNLPNPEPYNIAAKVLDEGENELRTLVTAAETAAGNAATSETNAHNSEQAAKASETAAATSASAAKTSETNAASSETAAATSATNAATSETNASNSASAAATSESNASDSATAAAASAAEVEAALDDYLPLSGGTLTGVVNGVTPTAGDDTTKLATTAYVQEEIRQHGNLPVGHEYFSMNPNVPQGSLPLLGGVYSRDTYADLWAWVQTQSGYLKTEAEWQTLSASNNGNVPFYSDGDGSTTFRVPSLKCWVKGANGTVSEVGSYLEAGLPNITGRISTGGEYGFDAILNTDNRGAFNTSTASQNGWQATTTQISIASKSYQALFDASLSNPIYGNANTVQPESIVGMWLVKAYGVIVDTGTIDEQQYIDDRFAAAKDYTDMEVSTGVPTGVVQAFAGSNIPNGWLICDGSAVSRTDYAALFAVIGTTYGAGNGSTTFNLPNLVDKFVEGSATAGTVKSAGLPNITGSFLLELVNPQENSTGAFYLEKGGPNNRDAYNGTYGWGKVYIDASRSSSIYGNSTTVQPPALTMRYIIKY